jgi:hypothetical protein
MKQGSEERAGPGAAVYTGLALSVIGALLDVASGYLLAPMSGGMPSTYVAEASMYLLGAAVLVWGLLSVTTVMAARMKWSGAGMEILGVVMAVVSGIIPGMNGGLSNAMLLVGALMIINGALMQRRRGMKQEKDR